jgi:hypothetical protein
MTAKPVVRWNSGKSCSYAPENPPDISTISCAGFLVIFFTAVLAGPLIIKCPKPFGGRVVRRVGQVSCYGSMMKF